jgi:hypothetical protein
MINVMKACLRELDYSDDQIRQMTPAKAREVINDCLRETGYSDLTLRSMTPEETLAAIRGDTGLTGLT